MTDEEIIRTALLRIQSAIGKYLNPGDPMTEAGFIDEVLAAADDQEVVRAMEGKK